MTSPSEIWSKAQVLAGLMGRDMAEGRREKVEGRVSQGERHAGVRSTAEPRVRSLPQLAPADETRQRFRHPSISMSGKKLLLLVLMVFASFALILCGGFWLWHQHTKSVLAAAQQRLRDAHLPMTVADIRPPAVPDADNAAPDIDKMGALLNALPQVNGEDFAVWFSDFQLKHTELRLDETATKELADQFDSPPVQAVLALIRQAAGKKGFDAKLDYSQALMAKIPYVGPLQTAARLIGRQARLEAARGQTDAAGTDVWNQANLADVVSREPNLIAMLTRVAVWGIALENMERLAATGGISPEWNIKFSQRLAALNLDAGLVAALDGERVMFGGAAFEGILKGSVSPRDLFGSLGGSNADERGQKLVMMAYRASGVLRLDYASYLDGMKERRKIAASAPPDLPAWESGVSHLPPIPDYALFSRIVLPTLESVAKNIWRPKAKIAIAQIGLALERYRAAKGGYPAALSDLVPEFIASVPADVFTGKPLLYRTEPGGAFIYSVGPNLKDDGGIENRDDAKDDISWAAGAAAVRKFAPPPASADAADPLPVSAPAVP